MKMWAHALPYKTMLPPNSNFESYVRETKSQCIESGISVPAERVDLIELGKKKAKAAQRFVDGRLEEVSEKRQYGAKDERRSNVTKITNLCSSLSLSRRRTTSGGVKRSRTSWWRSLW